MTIEKKLLTIFFRLPVWQRKQRSTYVVSRSKSIIITLNHRPKLCKAAIFKGISWVMGNG